MQPRFAGVLARASVSAIAFLLISYAHVVFGEVVPKNLAIEKADRLAILVAPALLVFYRVSAPLHFSRKLRPRRCRAGSDCAGGHGGGGHSAEELKFIVSSSRTEGHLHRFEEDAIQALLDFPNYYAREIMVPRNAIVSVSVDASLDQVLRRMREHEYSRLPVYESDPEHIIGYVHYKDMMRIWEERRIANARKRVAASVSSFARAAQAAGGARNQTAERSDRASSARPTRTWPWWWTSSAPSWAW